MISNHKGNVLLYIVVLMLIFGVLGVVMVSLFTTTTASTVTRNDSRRALYMAESGMRYAFSELRNNDFDQDVIDTLNTTTYTLNSPGSFKINVFGPWFESPFDQVINDTQMTLIVPQGELPDNYALPANSWLINFEYTGSDTDQTYMRSIISTYTKIDATTMSLDVTGDFNVAEGDMVCIGVKPAFEQIGLDEGDDIVIDPIAKDFFPPNGGAINVNRVDYSYERLVEEGGQVKLKNISASAFKNTLPAFPLNLEKPSDNPYTGEFIVLSTRNHTVVPTGTSDAVTYGGEVDFGLNIYDYSLPRPGSRKPDITADDLTSNLSEQETESRFFEVDMVEDKITIGGGGANQFGSAFYAGDESIGGDQDYCEQGACLFTLGVRAFFLLDFATQGDGITFTLTSFGPPLAPHNSATSVGGDIELSELMGYAGDSRLVPDPDPLNDLDFLATNPNDRGLDPPKIAVEFDTRTDNDTFDYCEDPLNANANQRTRNDPLSGEKDAVQYVFWGRTNFLNIPCRGLPPPPPPNDINNPLYDDNRHDADGEDAEEEWAFGTTGLVDSSPAIGSDGTIYVISGGILYAINPDGSPKWDFSTKTLLLSPAYDDNGTPADITDDTIYAVGSSDGFLYAIKSDGTQKGLSWPFNSGEDLDGGPTVGPDGTIYAGRDWNSAGDPGQVIAVNPDGTSKGLNWPFLVPSAVENDIDARPAVDDNGTPADTTDDTIYAASEDGFLYAINPDGTSKGLSWPFSVGYVTSRATIGADGTIYVGSRDSKVYAIKPDGTSKGLSWPFDTAGAIMTSPAYDDNGTPADITDDTIYIGSDDGHLYAINPNGTEKWRFPASGSIGAVQSSPAIDFDGTIYFGSNDGIVYAVNPDGTERWQFLTGGPVRSSPAIGKEGFIHIGSDDTNVYAINQFADPRNIKDKLLTFEDLGVNPIDLDDTNDWLNGKFGVKGPYAVRLEVDRSIIDGDGDGFFDYQLSLWIRQCQNLDCSDINGTFFSDTRIDYENAPASINLPMIQQFRLSAAEQVEFERFYFGFTGATGAGQTQDALISQFNLSFIRPGDPIVDVAAGDDLNWLP